MHWYKNVLLAHATAVENIFQIHTPFTNVLYDKSRYDK